MTLKVVDRLLNYPESLKIIYRIQNYSIRVLRKFSTQDHLRVTLPWLEYGLELLPEEKGYLLYAYM